MSRCATVPLKLQWQERVWDRKKNTCKIRVKTGRKSACKLLAGELDRLRSTPAMKSSECGEGAGGGAAARPRLPPPLLLTSARETRCVASGEFSGEFTWGAEIFASDGSAFVPSSRSLAALAVSALWLRFVPFPSRLGAAGAVSFVDLSSGILLPVFGFFFGVLAGVSIFTVWVWPRRCISDPSLGPSFALIIIVSARAGT